MAASADYSQGASFRIGVIGAGVMGRALIRGMLHAELVTTTQVRAAVNRTKSQEKLKTSLGIETAIHWPEEWTAETDVLLISTKPYLVTSVLQKVVDSGKLNPETLIISVAAGTSIETIERVIPHNPVVRAMPNTPCLVQAGVTVISPGSKAQVRHMQHAKNIFSAVGLCMELPERHMDAVTAVSGSGPAYAYLIMESLADGAVMAGLPRDTAFQLVAQTMLGSALMMQKTGKHPAKLKDEVTTPAGCTISALLTMEDGRIRSTLARAVEEATRIAGKLG